MKKISLLAVLLMLVLVVSVPAFAAETKAPEQTNARPAFNFLYGVFIPTQGSPIQFTGGDFPGQSSLGGAAGTDKTKAPGAFNFLYGVFIPTPGGISPIQFTGGDFPGKVEGEAKSPAAFNFLYGVFIPTPGGISPIQFTGGDFPGQSSLGGK